MHAALDVGGRVRLICSSRLVALALVFGAVACEVKTDPDTGSVADSDADTDADSDPDDPDDPDDPEDTAPPEPGDSVTVDLTIGPVYVGYEDLGEFPGLAGVPNVDDDDENGSPDWNQIGGADGDNDFALATVNTQGRDVGVALRGAGIRVYVGDALVLGDGGSAETTLSGVDSADLRVEFEDFMDQGELTFTDAELDETFSIALTASPLFFNHHLQASEITMALAVSEWGYRNDDFIEGYEDALDDGFLRMMGGRYDYDVWVQDEFEFAYATSPDAHLDIVFDTHRDGQSGPGGGLDDFPEDEFGGPDWLITNWGPRNATSLDYGGNFEISPPVTVDGVRYPYGRVYYGGAGGYQPLSATQNAVESMEVQKPFMPDSTWLCVGHIDETSTTIPDPSSEKGFKFVISDTRSAWELLEAMDPATELPQYAPGGWSGHSIDDVGEILDDVGLRALNDEIQELLDEQKDLFMEELGLTEDDIVYMPSLFEEPSGCGSWVAALIPGMANLVIADVDGEPTAFIADPFFRSDVDDQDSDPIIAHVNSIFPESLNTVFLDDWSVYHMGLGEVHCGTNVKREATNAWWQDAGHLITQEAGR
jgi:protein-arginine deiminase